MNETKYVKFGYFILGFCAFIYVLIRSFTVSLTYDEIWTITTFVPQSVSNIFGFIPCDANNHLANTLLIKLFFSTGSDSEFIARLPNVLALLIYLYFSYKITFNNLNSLIGLCCYLLLLFNPFLLDFFGLARGYGLALGFLSASLYYLINYIKDTKCQSAFFSLLFGSFSVLSNFPVLNYWLGLLFIINVFSYFKTKKKKTLMTHFVSLVVSVILIAIIYTPLQKLKVNGNLYYGGNSDFYNDTLISLTKYSLYDFGLSHLSFIVLNSLLIILILCIGLSYYFNRTRITIKNVLLCLSLFCIVSIVCQFYLLGTPYLTDRTALFLYPILILLSCFAFNEIPLKRYSYILISLITIGFCVNFYQNANLYKTTTWFFDAHSKQILEFVNENGMKQKRKIKIDFSWPFQASFMYYLMKDEYPFIEVVNNQFDREGFSPEAQYYIYLKSSLEKVGYNSYSQKIRFSKNRIVEEFEKENIVVFKLEK